MVSVAAGALTAAPMTANADEAFVGEVTTPDYIESDGDTYEYMYEYTVGGTAADKWYQDRSMKIPLDKDTMYDIKVKEYGVSGTSTERGFYFILRGGDGIRLDNTNYLQGRVMTAGDIAETTLKNIKGEIGSAILETKIICFAPGSAARIGATAEETGYRVTASDGVELIGAESGDYVSIGDTVAYAYGGKMYESAPITEPLALTPENAAGAGTETGDAIKITAGAGVELINLPENGYTLSGARIRYTYEGKTYLTEPVTSSINITSASDGTEVADDEYSKYLFVHFTGNDGRQTETGEQIYFSVSDDAIGWDRLNENEPILTSSMGTTGLRDPHIVRSPDGSKFYLIATDLHIYDDRNWDAAQYKGSKKIMIWESSDLVNWSEQREYAIGEDIDAFNVGCVWAPESIWDEERRQYMVFWASMVCPEKPEGYDDLTDETEKYNLVKANSKQRIYRSYTSDFVNFTKPEVYIERENHVIDTTILYQDGIYYRYSKDETTKRVGCDYSNSLDGPWTATELGIGNCEGPTAFKFNGENKWGLFVDSLGAGWSGYGLQMTENLLDSGYTFKETDHGESELRHGTVIPITDEEYNRLVENYPLTNDEPEEPGVDTTTYSFTEDTVASAGRSNSGDVQEWLINTTPEYFYIAQADLDSLEKITLRAGHGGNSAYNATYKLYAYDSGGAALTQEQLAAFKTDASPLGTEIAKAIDSNSGWEYSTITIDKSDVTFESEGDYVLDEENSSPLNIPDGAGEKALVLGVEYTNSSPTAYFDYITLSYNSSEPKQSAEPEETPLSLSQYYATSYSANSIGEPSYAYDGNLETVWSSNRNSDAGYEYFVSYQVFDAGEGKAFDLKKIKAIAEDQQSWLVYLGANDDKILSDPTVVMPEEGDLCGAKSSAYNAFAQLYNAVKLGNNIDVLAENTDGRYEAETELSGRYRYFIIAAQGWPATNICEAELYAEIVDLNPPTAAPTLAPTSAPSASPISTPTVLPTNEPSATPERVYPERWDKYADGFDGSDEDDMIVWHKFGNNSAGGLYEFDEDGVLTIKSAENVEAGDVCYGVTAVIKNIKPNTEYYLTFKEKTDFSEVTNSQHGFYLKPDTATSTASQTDAARITNVAENRNNSNNIGIHQDAHTDADWEEKEFVWTSGSGIGTPGDDVYAAKLEFTVRSAVGSVQIKDLVIREVPEPSEIAPTAVGGDGVKEHSVVIDPVKRSVTVPLYPGTDALNLELTVETIDGVSAELTSGTWEDGVLTLKQNGYTEEWTIKSVVRANPVIDGYYADPNIVIFGDTYYIYPTTDGGTNWDGEEFRCFSSKDLVNWTDEGVILDLDDVPWSTGKYGWAPTIAEKDGKYYFYFSAAGKNMNDAKQLGVAVADSPTGPFTALDTPMITSNNGYTSGGQMIDPHVFIDDDGQVYIYWGNVKMYAAKLNDDMVSVDWSTLVDITPANNYKEATFVIKRNGTYYFMWSDGDTGSWNYNVRYGTSSSPLGPIEGNNRILSRNNTDDPAIRGNAHHSVINIPGTDDWYICYHRFNIPLYGDFEGQASEPGNHREVCIDKMTFDDEGNIEVVTATLEGILEPVIIASPDPSPSPTASATSAPTVTPTAAPSASPTAAPTATPTAIPTAAPTASPASTPTASAEPTSTATAVPTEVPTSTPEPTEVPTSTPAPTAMTQPGDGWNVEYDGTANTATVTVPEDARAGERVSLFIAEYNEDGILTDLEAIDIEIERGRTEYEVKTQKGIVQNEENRVRIFLWDDGYRPLL